MPTECQADSEVFPGMGRREVVARFDGGAITSDAGGLLLREVEARSGIIARFARGFVDHRPPEQIEHTVEARIRQRVSGWCLGSEDLHDHDDLRHDPLRAVLVGKADPTGQDRAGRDQGKPLAGKRTLNRLELTPVGANADSRYQKIVARHSALEQSCVEIVIEPHATPPREIVLDLDATDDPGQGHPLGRFFQGDYREYGFLPLSIFCGQSPRCAQLRPADIEASAGSLKQVPKLVARRRPAWPEVVLTLRADSGFCRENLRSWCAAHNVRSLFGLPQNQRLLKIIGREQQAAKRAFEQSGQASRVFADFTDRTQNSWSAERRVVGKAEQLSQGANPRFVVTHIPATERAARELYEQDDCGRGGPTFGRCPENRIQEPQLCLFADRPRGRTLRANPLRLWFSTLADVVLNVLRERGLKGTPLATARCDMIRTKLLKIGATVTVTVRKVWVQLASACPDRKVFARVWQNLRDWAPRRGSRPPSESLPPPGSTAPPPLVETSGPLAVTRPRSVSESIRLPDRDHHPLLRPRRPRSP